MTTVRALSDVVVFVDPAASQSQLKSQRGEAAIVGVAQDHLRRIFVRFSWAAQCSTTELTDQIFHVNQLLMPQVIGVEANAMQLLYGEQLLREARQRGLVLPIRPVHQHTHREKDWRIRTALQQPIAEGRLFLRPEDEKLKTQILQFPQMRRKDLIDALASAVMLLPARPVAAQVADERTALVSYLRGRGMTPAQIARRVAELRPTSLGAA